MLVRRCLIALVILYGALLYGAPDVWAREKDPRLPPGTDPGGVALALISTGIDYTLPEIAGRLARDGEGQLIGRDFVDDDPLPYASAEGDQGGRGAVIARAILAEAPSTRLIPVRIDPQKPGSVSEALAFVARTPARAALVDPVGSDGEGDLMRKAAQEARHLLIVIPAAGALADLENVLAVASRNGGTSSEPRPDTDVAIQSMRLAAEIAESDPSLDGAGLKRAVLARLAR